jgi:hypothetical protein
MRIDGPSNIHGLPPSLEGASFNQIYTNAQIQKAIKGGNPTDIAGIGMALGVILTSINASLAESMANSAQALSAAILTGKPTQGDAAALLQDFAQASKQCGNTPTPSYSDTVQSLQEFAISYPNLPQISNILNIYKSIS